MKLSEFMASNGTRGIRHQRVRSRPARYLQLFVTCGLLFADDLDCCGGRAQLPGIDHLNQNLHPVFLSAHNGNLERRFRVFDLGHDRLLHNIQHNICVSYYIHL
jgi:hypothetical protein